MEITMRSLWTMIHGMGFGALYLLACSGGLFELYRFATASNSTVSTGGQERFLKAYLAAMVALAWASVLTGTYLIYPWYRAVPPAGTKELALFPQGLLMSNPSTVGWHSLGMEWKEHVAWLVPISITMVTFVFIRYGRELSNHRQLRSAVLGFATASFLAAGVAGFFGAVINKYAPVQGGDTVQLSRGRER
jgi:uncharacterized membrane protein